MLCSYRAMWQTGETGMKLDLTTGAAGGAVARAGFDQTESFSLPSPAGLTLLHFTQVIELKAVGECPLLREAGKVARSAGWGVESRSGSLPARSDGRAIRLPSKQRATPHPALRATFPSRAGEGAWKGAAKG